MLKKFIHFIKTIIKKNKRMKIKNGIFKKISPIFKKPNGGNYCEGNFLNSFQKHTKKSM